MSRQKVPEAQNKQIEFKRLPCKVSSSANVRFKDESPVVCLRKRFVVVVVVNLKEFYLKQIRKQEDGEKWRWRKRRRGNVNEIKLRRRETERMSRGLGDKS